MRAGVIYAMSSVLCIAGAWWHPTVIHGWKVASTVFWYTAFPLALAGLLLGISHMQSQADGRLERATAAVWTLAGLLLTSPLHVWAQVREWGELYYWMRAVVFGLAAALLTADVVNGLSGDPIRRTILAMGMLLLASVFGALTLMQFDVIPFDAGLLGDVGPETRQSTLERSGVRGGS